MPHITIFGTQNRVQFRVHGFCGEIQGAAPGRWSNVQAFFLFFLDCQVCFDASKIGKQRVYCVVAVAVLY